MKFEMKVNTEEEGKEKFSFKISISQQELNKIFDEVHDLVPVLKPILEDALKGRLTPSNLKGADNLIEKWKTEFKDKEELKNILKKELDIEDDNGKDEE